MKVAALNALPNGSTGKIMREILDIAHNEMNYEVRSYCGKWNQNSNVNYSTEVFGYLWENRVSGLISKITGFHHIWCLFGTIQLIKKLDLFSPDILHIHNLHLWNINVPMLFAYIKRKKIPVVWTFHDCWPITGLCPYFTMVNCEKWKTECNNCSQLKRYPGARFDQTKHLFKWKKKWFLGVDNLVIVTPSQWLKLLVKESYLKSYKTLCINNGVDTTIFSPQTTNLREKLGILNQKVILGVAFDWGVRKGLDWFQKLADMLSDDYKIVMVGVDEKTRSILNKRIIAISKTNDQRELAEFYSMADVFFNPTREDNYPTVNIESIACGTPVVTFNNGGSSENVFPGCGYVIDGEDVHEIIRSIDNAIADKRDNKVEYKKYIDDIDAKDCLRRYTELYHSICTKENIIDE